MSLVLFAGAGPVVPQDSFMYRIEHGVASILLDDDNCDCQSSLSLGHGMCYSTFDPKFGPANTYGVDLLSDPGCHTPSPDKGLTLYFKGIPLIATLNGFVLVMSCFTSQITAGHCLYFMVFLHNSVLCFKI